MQLAIMTWFRASLAILCGFGMISRDVGAQMPITAVDIYVGVVTAPAMVGGAVVLSIEIHNTTADKIKLLLPNLSDVALRIRDSNEGLVKLASQRSKIHHANQQSDGSSSPFLELQPSDKILGFVSIPGSTLSVGRYAIEAILPFERVIKGNIVYDAAISKRVVVDVVHLIGNSRGEADVLMTRTDVDYAKAGVYNLAEGLVSSDSFGAWSLDRVRLLTRYAVMALPFASAEYSQRMLVGISKVVELRVMVAAARELYANMPKRLNDVLLQIESTYRASRK